MTPVKNNGPDRHGQAASLPVVEATVTVLGELGLHARPAAKIARSAQQFSAEVLLFHGEYEADATSILDILSLSAVKGSRIVVRCKGPDAEAALFAISRLVSGGQEER